jgi:hypothetical protein
MTLDAIKEAIQYLPEEERRKLAGWFKKMEELAWDEDLGRHFSPGGRGHPPLIEIQREASEGKARQLEDGLAQRRNTHS